MTEALPLSPLEKTVINRLQYGLPAVPRPFDALAGELGISPADIVETLRSLQARGILMRLGPLYNAVHMGGEVSLVGMAVPQDRFDEVCEIVNSYPEVAHNYERDHAINMWFVVSTETPGRTEEVLADIARRTGLTPLNMPKEEEYYVGLYFQV